MLVKCRIDEITLQNDNGRYIESVQATCSECGHTTESFGTESNSIARCLVMLKEECPQGQRNFYTEFRVTPRF